MNFLILIKSIWETEMNTGVISSRYAKALLKYAESEGVGELVCRQSLALSNVLQMSEVRSVFDGKSSVSDSKKLSLLESALNESLSPVLSNFLKLVLKRGRSEYLRYILQDFTDIYFKSNKILFARLVTTVESVELEERLRSMVIEATGCKQLNIITEIDPELIGGFVFTLDDIRIDSSIKRQLDTLRKQFNEKNKRLI